MALEKMIEIGLQMVKLQLLDMDNSYRGRILQFSSFDQNILLLLGSKMARFDKTLQNMIEIDTNFPVESKFINFTDLESFSLE